MSMTTLLLMNQNTRRREAAEDLFFRELSNFTVKDLPPVSKMRVTKIDPGADGAVVVRGEWGTPGNDWFTATVKLVPGEAEASVRGYKSAMSPDGGATGIDAEGTFGAEDTQIVRRKAQGLVDAGLVDETAQLKAALRQS